VDDKNLDGCKKMHLDQQKPEEKKEGNKPTEGDNSKE
jgi:hypothetical protein